MATKVVSINGFKLGLDKRKAEISAVPGALVTLSNGFINQGAEIEKRKAFVQAYNVSVLDGSGDTGTFGYEVTSSGHVVFGSALPNGTTPTQGQPVLASALPAGVTYHQLKHPAVLEGQTYDRTKHRMTEVVHSHNYGGKAWVVATFADGTSFVYYDEALVQDFSAGLILTHLAGDTNANRNLIATHLINRIDETNFYDGSDPAGDGNLDIAAPLGSNFNVTIDETSTSGAIAQTSQADEVPTRDGTSAMATFRIMAGTEGVKASGTLTSTGTAPANGDTVVIGNKTYTFRTALTTPAVVNEVLIGASAAASLDNLKSAINGTTGAGSTYSTGTTAHSQVEATTNTDTTQLVVARVGGTAANNYDTTETSSQLSWGASKLSGGTDPNYISAIEVGPDGGPFTNLIGSNVPWSLSDETTATNVATEINSESGTTGFSATANGDTIEIYGTAAQGDAYNGWLLKVTAVGNLCVGNLYFEVSAANANFKVTSLIADAVELLSGAPHSLSTTLEALIEAVSSDINDASGTHGYTSCPRGKLLFLSKLVTASNDGLVDVYMVTEEGGALGDDEDPPEGVATPSPASLSYTHSVSGQSIGVTSASVTCVMTGGAPPYATFLWRLVSHTVSNPNYKAKARTILSPNSQSTRFQGTYPSLMTIGERSVTVVDRYVCDIVDNRGIKYTSSELVITTTLNRQF